MAASVEQFCRTYSNLLCAHLVQLSWGWKFKFTLHTIVVGPKKGNLKNHAESYNVWQAADNDEVLLLILPILVLSVHLLISIFLPHSSPSFRVIVLITPPDLHNIVSLRPLILNRWTHFELSNYLHWTMSVNWTFNWVARPKLLHTPTNTHRRRLAMVDGGDIQFDSDSMCRNKNPKLHIFLCFFPFLWLYFLGVYLKQFCWTRAWRNSRCAHISHNPRINMGKFLANVRCCFFLLIFQTVKLCEEWLRRSSSIFLLSLSAPMRQGFSAFHIRARSEPAANIIFIRVPYWNIFTALNRCRPAGMCTHTAAAHVERLWNIFEPHFFCKRQQWRDDESVKISRPTLAKKNTRHEEGKWG